MNERTGEVGKIHSLAFKVMLCSLAIYIVAMSGVMAMSVGRSTNTLETVYLNYTKNVAEAAANTINTQMEVTAQNVVLDDGSTVSSTDIENYLISLLEADPDGQREAMSDTFSNALGDIELTGVEGSYAYFVSSDGTMAYHPTTDKIGAPVENAAVKGLVSRLQSGESAQSIGNGSVIYEYKGSKKYAGYAFTSGGNIVLVTGDYGTIMSPVNSLIVQLIFATIASLIFVILVTFYAIRRLLRPLKLVNEIINDTASFNFRHNEHSDALCKRKDEIGTISNNVRDMREKLRDIIHQIAESCDTIVTNVDALINTTEDVNNMCTDNSATTEELSASMEETSASTDLINGNISTMVDESKVIDSLSEEGAKLSDEVIERASSLRITTEEAAKKTRSMYENVRVKADEAIESSKVVEKINELTNTIMSISSQTSLLALNASIEAARAGDAGRGFAVVATEIGSLADQTATSVQNIDKIVAEVNGAVQKMSACLEETTQFLEQNVLTDYDGFQEVSEQYRDDADRFKESMVNIKGGVDNLNSNIQSIASSVTDIGTAIGESAKGVTDIAEKTTDIVAGTSTTLDKVSVCKQCVDDLNGIVDLFVLE